MDQKTIGNRLNYSKTNYTFLDFIIALPPLALRPRRCSLPRGCLPVICAIAAAQSPLLSALKLPPAYYLLIAPPPPDPATPPLA